MRYTSNVRRISDIELEKVLSELLDISEAHHDLAVTRYTGIGNWLDLDTRVVSFRPQIYPQGSFRLGTVTKSISGEDDYDLDFVTELKQPRDDITPWGLKNLVGDAIKTYVSNSSYQVSLQEEGRRCWTLDYSGDVQFHMDVLPAIPATKESYQQELRKLAAHRSAAIGQNLEIASNVSEDAIAITDKPSEGAYVWLLSNPKGYAKWFTEMSIIRGSTVTSAVESAPNYQRKKSPLQRVVQMLKRHRDIWIEKQNTYYKSEKPISVIITTLAAKAYRYKVDANETEILQALQTVAENMLDYIETVGGVDWVRNPVNEHENFADKWEQYPKRRRCFVAWHEQVCSDLMTLNKALGSTYATDEDVWKALALFLDAGVVAEARTKSMLSIRRL